MLIYGYVCLGFLGCGFETKPNNRPNEGVVVKLLLEKNKFCVVYFSKQGEEVLWPAVIVDTQNWYDLK